MNFLFLSSILGIITFFASVKLKRLYCLRKKEGEEGLVLQEEEKLSLRKEIADTVVKIEKVFSKNNKFRNYRAVACFFEKVVIKESRDIILELKPNFRKGKIFFTGFGRIKNCNQIMRIWFLLEQNKVKNIANIKFSK